MTRALDSLATDRELTFEEYMATPETMLRHEVIDGVIVMSPSPTYRHQDILFNLGQDVKTHVKLHQLGMVSTPPADVLIRKRPKLRVRQPDLMFIARGRMSRDEVRKVQILA